MNLGFKWIPLSLCLVFFACTPKHEKPNFVYMPDMAYSPAIKAQEPEAVREIPKGTIPRGFRPYPYPDAPEKAKLMRNPKPMTKKVLMRGKKMFNVYCLVCHGKLGEGDGPVTPKFPRPPSLQTAKIKGWTDGDFFHIMTVGRNLMPSYQSQVSDSDRWAIAHYIRVLHRAKNPTERDLERAKDW